MKRKSPLATCSAVVGLSLAAYLLPATPPTFRARPPAQGGGSARRVVSPQSTICPPGSLSSFPFHPGADIFVIEGPIEAYDLVQRTMTIAGTTFWIPATLDVDNDGDGLGDVPLGSLLDPALESQHSILGGSGQVEGHLVSFPNCLQYVADVLFVEFAEHLQVGPLTLVDPVLGVLEVNGTPVRMNTDPRFPSRLSGAGQLPLAVADLVGFEGSLVEVEGYLDGGFLNATAIEGDAYVTDPLVDTVIIERADWDADKGQLSLRGFATPDPASGAFATSVDCFIEDSPSGNPACGGVFAMTVTTTIEGVIPVAAFRYKSPSGAYPSQPAHLCVESPFGGMRRRSIDLDD